VEEHNCEVAERKLKFNTEQYITKPSSANVHEPEAPVSQENAEETPVSWTVTAQSSRTILGCSGSFSKLGLWIRALTLEIRVLDSRVAEKRGKSFKGSWRLMVTNSQELRCLRGNGTDSKPFGQFD
jgi:hypothetical protein